MSPHDTTPVLRGGPPPVPRPPAPAQLGRYRLVGLLGRGGMGAVYEAADALLGRRVALKVMLPEVAAADPRGRDRFLREAQAQARVEHDHVVPVFEVGEAGGVPFLTMPLLRGATLAAALAANPRPPLRAALRIGRQVAEGLAAAHAAGLVHRDVKPGNVWLEAPSMRVKVLDFGLARGVDPEPGEAPAAAFDSVSGAGDLTAAGVVVGTPYYMSPEQARGAPLDHRSDLFAVGIVLYEMLTGRPPFPGHSTGAVLRALADADPPPPSAVVPGLPPALNDLVVRLLSKDPAARPPTAAAVAAELRAVEFGLAAALAEPPAAPAGPWAEIVETTPLEPAPPTKRRVPAAAWGGLVLVAAAAGGLAAALSGGLAARGEVVVEADPALEVVVKRGDAVVRGPTRERRFALPPGEYAVEPADPAAKVTVLPPRVTVGRDARTVVGVWPERARPAPAPPAVADRERDAALFLRQTVKAMMVRLDTGRDVFVDDTTALPNEPFAVLAVWFPADAPADAADRVLLPAAARLRGLSTVAGLRLTPAQLDRLAATPTRDILEALPAELDPGPDTVAALAKFPKLLQASFAAADAARLPALAALPALVNDLILFRLPAGADLPSAARAALAGYRGEHLRLNLGGRFDAPLADAVVGVARLKGLSLGRTPADLGAVASLSRSATLAELTLEAVGLTDADLPRLAGLVGLRKLDLRGNALSTDAVTRLWSGLVRCEVLWDGGSLAPRP